MPLLDRRKQAIHIKSSRVKTTGSRKPIAVAIWSKRERVSSELYLFEGLGQKPQIDRSGSWMDNAFSGGGESDLRTKLQVANLRRRDTPPQVTGATKCHISATNLGTGATSKSAKTHQPVRHVNNRPLKKLSMPLQRGRVRRSVSPMPVGTQRNLPKSMQPTRV